jgi:hypothetical protein
MVPVSSPLSVKIIMARGGCGDHVAHHGEVRSYCLLVCNPTGAPGLVEHVGIAGGGIACSWRLPVKNTNSRT